MNLIDTVVVAGPNLEVDLCQASMLPQTEEDEKAFVTKYIVGVDTSNDTGRNDRSNSQDSQKSS